jgi:hypothetical protein
MNSNARTRSEPTSLTGWEQFDAAEGDTQASLVCFCVLFIVRAKKLASKWLIVFPTGQSERRPGAQEPAGRLVAGAAVVAAHSV